MNIKYQNKCVHVPYLMDSVWDFDQYNLTTLSYFLAMVDLESFRRLLLFRTLSQAGWHLLLPHMKIKVWVYQPQEEARWETYITHYDDITC